MKYWVYFCIILFCSCTNAKRDDSAISLKEVSGKMTYEELYSPYECISVETSDKSIMGPGKKLLIYDDKYFIMDKFEARKVFVFNSDGSFSHTIGSVGNGPGEYGNNMEDFTIDEERGRVVVLSYPSTVYVYNIDGSFIESKKLGESSFWNICSYKDGYVCSTNHQTYTEGENAFLLFLFDNDFNLTDKMLPVLPVFVAWPPMVSNPLFCTGKEIVYIDGFTSKVHFLPVGNPKELQSLRFDLDHPVSPETCGNFQLFLDRQIDHSYFIEACFDDDILYLFFKNKGISPVRICILNVKTGQKRIHEFDGIPNSASTCHAGYFYYLAPPEAILEDENNLYETENVNYPITMDSNRIIVRFRTKDVLN